MNTTQLWTNIIAYAVQVGLLVGIGAALPTLLRLKSPRARLLYWQLLLVACLALPWVRPWHSEIVAISIAPVIAAPAVPNLAASAPSSLHIPPAAQIALWLLAAGVVIRIAWLAAGFLKLARYRRHGHAIPLPREWNTSSHPPRLLISDEIGGPVTFGFFRPVVLLPARFPAMSGPMRDAILFHELLHVERRDWLFTLGEELLRAVFWCHPAIWWVLGEIQLAREQTVDLAVIDMTQARDPYVDTLLAMAGVTAELDLAPAPLFLRRRHLKQRVIGIVQEVVMSKPRLILAQVAALAMVATACWFIAGAIPLQAQAQLAPDAPGVTVNLNGAQLMHRSPVAYPIEAIAKGIEGTVVVQIHLDANGEVIDDAILSGPDELRRAAQQSVLSWHFDKSEGSTTRTVNIDFAKPANSVAGTVPAIPTRAQMVGSAPSAAGQSDSRSPSPQQTAVSARTLENIVVTGLSDSARDNLLAHLPIHAGDSLSSESLSKAIEAARTFDPHLSGMALNLPDGNAELRITVSQQPGAFGSPAVIPPAQPVNSNIPPGAQRIGGNVMAAKLISKVMPIYPPLAKMARQQGTVRFEAIVGKDGTIENLNFISGPPLLVAVASDAVNRWVYAPTLLNGVPVEVVTTVDVDFTLQ